MSRTKRGEVQENTVFTVTYLGAADCRALRGEDVTEPLVKSFIYGDSEEGDTGKRQATGTRNVVMDVGQKEISMTELVTKKNKVEKKKLAPIPARDVTYAAPAFPPNNDMFVVIVLRANSKSKHVVRAHVFKCDTTDVAAKIVELLMRAASSASSKAYVAKVEDDLLRRKLIEPSVDRSSYVLGNFHQSRASLCSTSSGNPAPVFASSSQPAANGGMSPVSPMLPASTAFARDRHDKEDVYQNLSARREHQQNGDVKPVSNLRITQPKSAAEEPPVDYSDGEDDLPAETFDPMESIKALDDVLLKAPQSRESQVYDSVADELRRKLVKGRGEGNEGQDDEGPLLLPPKDYDTVHRQQGRLDNIDERRSQNSAIVGSKNAVWGPEEAAAADSAKNGPVEVGKLRQSQLNAVSVLPGDVPSQQPCAANGKLAVGGGTPTQCLIADDDLVIAPADHRLTPEKISARSSTDEPQPSEERSANSRQEVPSSSSPAWRRTTVEVTNTSVMNLRAAYRGGDSTGAERSSSGSTQDVQRGDSMAFKSNGNGDSRARLTPLTGRQPSDVNNNNNMEARNRQIVMEKRYTSNGRLNDDASTYNSNSNEGWHIDNDNSGNKLKANGYNANVSRSYGREQTTSTSEEEKFSLERQTYSDDNNMSGGDSQPPSGDFKMYKVYNKPRDQANTSAVFDAQERDGVISYGRISGYDSGQRADGERSDGRQKNGVSKWAPVPTGYVRRR